MTHIYTADTSTIVYLVLVRALSIIHVAPAEIIVSILSSTRSWGLGYSLDKHAGDLRRRTAQLEPGIPLAVDCPHTRIPSRSCPDGC